jgi:hypothetical protein
MALDGLLVATAVALPVMAAIMAPPTSGSDHSHALDFVSLMQNIRHAERFD